MIMKQKRYFSRSILIIIFKTPQYHYNNGHVAQCNEFIYSFFIKLTEKLQLGQE